MDILFLSFSLRCVPGNGVLEPDLTVRWSLKSCRWGMAFPSQWFVLLSLSSPAWLQRMSGVPLLPVYFLSHSPTSLLSQEAQTQTLHSVYRPPLASHARWGLEIPSPCSLYSSWPVRVSGREPCFESDLFACMDTECTYEVPAQPCLTPLFYKVPMWHPYCSYKTLPSFHAPHFPKRQ